MTAVISAVTSKARPKPASASPSVVLPASGGWAATAGSSVLNWRAEVNDVSKPNANGTNVITAPTPSAG